MPNQTDTQENIKEKEQVKKDQGQKNFTVKQRIDAVIDKYDDKDELKKQMFKLVQHILYPEQFCPECDERMFLDAVGSVYNCSNCGYQSPVISKVATVTVTNTPPTTQEAPQKGPVPEQVEKAIAQAEEAIKETAAPGRTTALGDKIRKLVAERDAGGPTNPTPDDEARVKGSSQNVSSKINWV